MSGEQGSNLRLLHSQQYQPHPSQPLMELCHHQGVWARDTGTELEGGSRDVSLIKSTKSLNTEDIQDNQIDYKYNNLPNVSLYVYTCTGLL